MELIPQLEGRSAAGSTQDLIRSLPEFPKVDGCAFYALIQAIKTLYPATNKDTIRRFLRSLNPATSPIMIDAHIVDFAKGAVMFDVYDPNDDLAQKTKRFFNQIFEVNQLPLALDFIPSRKSAMELLATARQREGFLLIAVSFYTKKKLETLSNFFEKDMFTYQYLDLGHRIGIAADEPRKITIHDLNQNELDQEKVVTILDDKNQFVHYKQSPKFGEVYCKASRLPAAMVYKKTFN